MEQNDYAKRCINILLMRYPDRFSKLFRLVSRSDYNHASIGISDTDGIFYSYGLKGFRKETPKDHPKFKEKEVPCCLYRIEVSEDIYGIAKSILHEHEKDAINFKFTYFGVALCILKIGYKRKERYFCSQFVSEVLDQLKAVPLEKQSSLYLPDDFMKIQELNLSFKGYLSELFRLQLPLAQ